MHRFIPDANAAPDTPLNPEHAAALRRWTRELLRLPGDTVVTINDRPCVDPGCPVVETTVTVFETDRTRAWTFARPAVAVTKLMLAQTLRAQPASSRSRPQALANTQPAPPDMSGPKS